MNRVICRSLVMLTLLSLPIVVLAQQVEVEELILENGMKFLLVRRGGDPNVAAGWVAKVGSANERPGITGLSHLFEHMMFKGTHKIGTLDIEKDLETIRRLDEVKSELGEEEANLIERLRLGEIEDLNNPDVRSPRHLELLEEFDRLLKAQKELLIQNEFNQIYTRGGASGLNATTNQDLTLYFLNVPSNKLELWFWMESDRLRNPVFREFYSERDVVFEERRLRTDSTPIGKFQEEFESMFWTSHPYGWPVVGWPSDLDGLTREEALAYFDLNYSPNNLVACLVGDFDPAQVRQLAESYFGSLQRSPRDPDPVRTREVGQPAEKRMIAYAETTPQVGIRYHSVADGHVDEPALVVLGSLLNGRTGRLYKSLVLEQEIANSAFAGQNGLKWAGYFSLQGTAKPGHTPEEVEQALYRELDKLKAEPISERELQKVKNRFNADNFRRIENNFFLMFQLLIAESNRGWRTFNSDPQRIQEVTAEDVRRVAQKYFEPETRAVAIYYTKQDAAEEDPLLAGLSPQEKVQIRQLKSRLSQIKTIEEAQQMLQRFEAQAGSAPPEIEKLMHAFRETIKSRILELEGGQQQ